jgi:alkylation response protein AidB-like acyl-CoA dehydrogenase
VKVSELLGAGLAAWLDEHAAALDESADSGPELLQLLAARGLFGAGVPEDRGGRGGTTSSAASMVAALAEHSLCAAFVFWAQRAVIECLLLSPNRGLADELLPRLLDGSLAAAPGLSNAMRTLSGFDRLHVQHAPAPGGGTLTGEVAWATNLAPRGIVVVVAAGAEGPPALYAVPGDAAGVELALTAGLMGLRASRTGSVRLDDVHLSDRWRLHADARAFLPTLRPAFLAFQCGWGVGLARASLRAARRAGEAAPSILAPEIEQLEHALDTYWRDLSEGADGGRLQREPASLFGLRLRMVDLATAAVQLELQALGGRAYLPQQGAAFARRWREAAFLPIVTPSAVQLKTELARADKG